MFLGAEREDCEVGRDEVVWSWKRCNTRFGCDLAERLNAVLRLIDRLHFFALIFERFSLNKHDQVLASELADIVLDQIWPKLLH